MNAARMASLLVGLHLSSKAISECNSLALILQSELNANGNEHDEGVAVDTESMDAAVLDADAVDAAVDMELMDALDVASIAVVAVLTLLSWTGRCLRSF